MMTRIQARSAEARVEELTNFVRSLSKATDYDSRDTGRVIDYSWVEKAQEILCGEPSCFNAPEYIANGWFCRQHAPQVKP